jgi:hypothetical protein
MDIEAPSGARSQYLRSNERGGFPCREKTEAIGEWGWSMRV